MEPAFWAPAVEREIARGARHWRALWKAARADAAPEAPPEELAPRLAGLLQAVLTEFYPGAERLLVE